jgi:tetratricopeptide (TPR) repeat protein
LSAFPSQHESASTPGDARAEEIERITRVVLAVLDAKGAQRSEERSRAARLRDFLLTNWPVTTLLLSVAALGIAAFFYDASPGYYFKQLAISDRELDAKEQQFAYEQAMAEKHIALGRALLDQGRFKDAGAAFTEALGFDKHSVEARLGKFKAEFFSPSSEKQFDPAVVEQRIATLFMNLGTGGVYDMSQMSDTQTFALLTNPGSRGVYDPHALTALGDLMFEAGRDDEARFYYGRAIALRPELAHAHAGLAAIAFEENDFATAAEAMQKAHDLAPSHPDYRTNLAAALLYAGRHVDAIDHYQEIFKIDQEKLSPYLECALAFRMQGNFGKASPPSNTHWTSSAKL